MPSAGEGPTGVETALRDRKEKVSGPTRERGGGGETGAGKASPSLPGRDTQHLQTASYESHVIAITIHDPVPETPRRHSDTAAQTCHVVGKGVLRQHKGIP